MPPKKPEKKSRILVFQSTIDAGRHAEKLKEIEERHLREAELAELEVFDEEGEEEMGSEEGDYEYEESIPSDIEPDIEIGRIDLSFPETADEFSDSPYCYPPSYYTLSCKERLLLLYTENFRKQFFFNYPKRRPLVLALPNECNVQKFVCTTIRPTGFLHVPLIRDEEGIAKFVADFIIYEPLEDCLKFPTRLISPATLLRRRRGNCYEMATLLCSILIGAGFSALVVSGVARKDTVQHELRNIPYPYEIEEVKVEEEAEPVKPVGTKYKLKPMPDLVSHLEENMAELKKIKEAEEQQLKEEAEGRMREALQYRPVDRFHYRRNHAWVVILDNVPWGIKPTTTHLDEDGEVVEEPPRARFIEPASGFMCEESCKQYVLIDSVWNNFNYYVNKQTYQRVTDIRWDLRNTADWEHLLPGEPPEMRMHEHLSDTVVADAEPPIEEEKHLDTIRSWVMKLHIGTKEFEERFPDLKKTTYYKRAKHERFSPYTQRDGKMMELTLYSDNEYKEPTVRWEYYKNRVDMLQQIKYTYENDQTEETFAKIRDDCLKYLVHSSDPQKPKIFHYYSGSRLDSRKEMQLLPECIIIKYADRNDLCYYQEFQLKKNSDTLKIIVEKFHRNTSKGSVHREIAERIFFLNQNKILLKYHYSTGALTASTIEFTKPPKPDYGKEIKYEPSLTKIYKSNVVDPDPTPLELYDLLLEQLQYEEKIKKQFEKIMEDMQNSLERRTQEMEKPLLTFSIFDPLRNGAARAIRMKQEADAEAFKREMASKPPDFLAPYLVTYENRALTYDESWAVLNACLNDMKTRFVVLLNDLQRYYDDLTLESKALKRFMNRFDDQFQDYDFQRLMKEADDIELHKRMIQQRLKKTHQESQKKYEVVKEALLKDVRLNLHKSSEQTPEQDDF